jgi:hypothetical protein
MENQRRNLENVRILNYIYIRESVRSVLQESIHTAVPQFSATIIKVNYPPRHP